MKDATLDCQKSFCVWPGRRYWTIWYFLFEPYKLRLKYTRKEVGWLCSQGKKEIRDNLGVAKNETNFASGFKKDNYVDFGEKTRTFHGSFHLHTLVISTVVETEVMSLNALKSGGLGGLPCSIYENTSFKSNTKHCAYS